MKKYFIFLKISNLILGLVLIVCVFKNISYPLFWADESMTIMGTERVLQYGYPKSHDGKNTLNDLYCTDPKMAVNEEDDAFIGGASWGQYYYGTIGYALADKADDMYTKTGIVRSTFAFIGIAGIFLLIYFMSGLFTNGFTKQIFIFIFLLCEFTSCTLLLHLKEVRYYSIAFFISAFLLSIYVRYRFYKPFNNILFIFLLSASSWLLFNTFSPLYFIFSLSIGLSEIIMMVFEYVKTKKLMDSFKKSLPVIVSLAIAFFAVSPLLIYFKTFARAEVNYSDLNFNFSVYKTYLALVIGYFENRELFWLALAMRIGILLNIKKVMTLNSPLFKASNYFTLLFIVFVFSIPKIPTGIFSRYLIYMQPVLCLSAIFDFFLLFKLFLNDQKNIFNAKTVVLIITFSGLFSYTVLMNLPYLRSHLFEMTHQYKGPLDYTIPFIKSNFTETDKLVIATNYEETSYMYYLKSKVIVGNMCNNIASDSLLSPDIISRRYALTMMPGVFDKFHKQAVYDTIVFPLNDATVNNIPELYTEPQHKFVSDTSSNGQNGQVILYVKKGLRNR